MEAYICASEAYICASEAYIWASSVLRLAEIMLTQAAHEYVLRTKGSPSKFATFQQGRPETQQENNGAHKFYSI